MYGCGLGFVGWYLLLVNLTITTKNILPGPRDLPLGKENVESLCDPVLQTCILQLVPFVDRKRLSSAEEVNEQ